jgi:hypothetical protein
MWLTCFRRVDTRESYPFVSLSRWRGYREDNNDVFSKRVKVECGSDDLKCCSCIEARLTLSSLVLDRRQTQAAEAAGRADECFIPGTLAS